MGKTLLLWGKKRGAFPFTGIVGPHWQGTIITSTVLTGTTAVFEYYVAWSALVASIAAVGWCVSMAAFLGAAFR